MIDPKMLELSTYDGIPHLPDACRHRLRSRLSSRSNGRCARMEDRYRKMSKLGVRNIDGYNARLALAEKKRETLTRHRADRLPTRTPARPVYEQEELSLDPIALHRRHHRRDGRPYDGRRQGHRRQSVQRPWPRWPAPPASTVVMADAASGRST